MFTQEHSDDYTPITVIGNLPIYLAELLVGLHLVSMALAALWSGFTQSSEWSQALLFDPYLILNKGQIWRLFSYAVLDVPPAGFGGVIWFLVGLLMLWWCGRQVEQFYGQKNFLKSYVLLILIPAITGLIPGLGMQMAGPTVVHFGVFAMFAATYPGVQLMFGIPAKWMVWAILFFNSLVYFSNRSLAGMIWLWVSALTAYGLTRLMGRGEWLPEKLKDLLPTFRQPKFTVVRSESVRLLPAKEEDPIASIDPILEKIGRSGLASLTTREHAALRAASGELQKKSLR